MTLEKLKNYRNIKTTIEINKELLTELETKLEPSIAHITDVPAKQKYKESKLDLIVPQIIELKKVLLKQINDLLALQIEIELFIESIPDLQDQNIIKLRFVCGFSWRQIAHRIGGFNTEESVKKRATRLIKRMCL